MLRKLNLAKAVHSSSISKLKGSQTLPLTYKFATLITKEQEKAREVIRRAADQLEADAEMAKFDEFCKKLYDLYEREEQRKENINKRNNEFLINALTSKFPVRDAIKTYKVYQKGFDDEHLAACLEQLARLHKALADKPTYYTDMTRPELLENWRFFDMIEDIKYMMLKGNPVGFDNLVKVAESLNKLGYKDHEIQTIFLEKLNRLWNNQDDGFEVSTDPHQNPQYFKKGYYSKGDNEISLKNLLQNPEFKSHIDTILTKRDHQRQRQIQIDSNESPETQEISYLLEKLSNTIKKNDDAYRKLGQSIIAIRDQFTTLNEVQKEEFIISNNFLRSELLELEEFLIDAGLLSLKDIFDPKNITDPQLKNENASNILSNLLLEQKEITIDPNIVKYLETAEQIEAQENPEQASSAEDLKVIFDKHAFARCLAALTELAASKKGLYENEKCVNDRWKDLLPNLKLEEIVNRARNFKMSFEFYKLTSQYSEIWHLMGDYLKSSYSKLIAQFSREQPSSKNLEGAINLAYTYTIIHLSSPAKNFLHSVALVEEHFNSISQESFLRLLKTLNYVSNFEKKDFTSCVQNYVNIHIREFNAETALEVAHFYAVNGLHQTKEFARLLKLVNRWEIDNAITEITPYQTEILNDLNIFLSTTYPETSKNDKEAKSLSSHLQLYLRTRTDPQKLSENAFTDPLKELITNTLIKSFNHKFSNLLPSFVQKLSSEYQPSLFYRNNEGKVGVFVGDGKIISADEGELSSVQQFRFNLLEKIYPDIKCRGVSYLQFLDIDYRNAQISFKENNYLESILEDISAQNKSLKALREISLALIDQYNSFLKSEATQQRSNSDFEFFFEQLEQFFLIEKEYNGTVEQEQRLTYSDKLKYRLAYLYSAFQRTNEETKAKINQLSQSQFGKDFSQVLHSIKDGITSKRNTSQDQEIASPKWAGIIYGEQIPINTTLPAEKKNIDRELLNYPFLWDADYHNYNDWREQLDENLNKNNVDFTHLQNPVNFHGEKRVPTGLIPNTQKLRNSIQPLSFPWSWEVFSYKMPLEYFKKYLTEEMENLVFQKPLKEDFNVVANLQNLKVEWKATLNEAQISNKLVELDFIEELIQEHLGLQSKSPYEEFSLICERKPDEYMIYLEKLSRGWLLKDHYANFFFNEGFKKEEARAVKEEFKRKNREAYDEYLNHNISLDEMNRITADLKKQYTVKLAEYIVEDVDNNEIVSNNVRAYGTTFDFKSLGKQTDFENLYNYKADPDYRRSNKDLQGMLALKRRKAETKLIKLRLIKKLHEGKQLSNLETQYLKKWQQSIKETPLIDLDLNMVPKAYTKRSIGSLSEKDRKSFEKMDFFDVQSLNNVALTDLILEVALFFDEATINRMETQVKGQEISKEWGISSEYKFDFADNREVRLVFDTLEEYIWRQGGKFSTEEIESIHDMYGVLRGNTKLDKAWHKVDDQSLTDFIGVINEYDNRAKLLEEWFDKKEKEFLFKRYVDTPPQFLKPDNFYRKIFQPRLEKKIRTSVEEIFEKSYDKIERADLHLFVENLIERLYLLKKYLPKKLNFVLKGVLTHPNLSILDRNNLESALNIQNISVEVSHSKLLPLNDVEIRGDKLPEEKEFSQEKLRNAIQHARIPFISALSKKFQSL